MATWKVKANDGSGWTVIAPDDVSEAEVNAFAEANADSWVNGATYRMEPDAAPAAAQPAASTDSQPTKDDYDNAVAVLKRQISDIDTESMGLAQKDYRSPSLGTPNAARVAELAKKSEELKATLSKLEIGDVGQTVGGIGGALAGGAAGAVLGSPAGPPGMAIGGVIGSILGGAGGVAAGTRLWDIPQARETREVTDQEAVELIKARAIESVVWDGAFVLILGPGGRAVAKMTKGTRLLPALKAAAKESFGWDQLPKVKSEQLAKVIEQRAAVAPPGLGTPVSRALDVPTLKTSREATENLLTDIAAKSGRVPTKGEMTGLVEGTESYVRSQAPAPFFKNYKELANASAEIRASALSDLDKAGALTGPELGTAVARVAESADRTLKRVTGPVFDRARQQLVTVDMRPAIKVLDAVIDRYERSAGSLGGITKAEIALLRDKFERLKATPNMWIDGAQDFVSGNKAAQRVMVEGNQPSDTYSKVLGDLVQTSDTAYLNAVRSVPDKTLAKDLLNARNLYRETLSDLRADTMASLADKRPEAYGAALTGKGHVTEIRELRAALDRAVENAPRRQRQKGGAITELSKSQMRDERLRIDAGMVKGFIEKHTQSLTTLETKLTDPDFRLTLKELLTGRGVADPVLGQNVLESLNRTLGAVKIAAPEIAPQPGRFGLPGTGSIGLGSAGAALTGNIQSAVPLMLATVGVSRLLGKAAANYMTTGNAGMLHAIGRGAALSKIAGKNAAAAEAARATLMELDGWDRATGGAGLQETQ